MNVNSGTEIVIYGVKHLTFKGGAMSFLKKLLVAVLAGLFFVSMSTAAFADPDPGDIPDPPPPEEPGNG